MRSTLFLLLFTLLTSVHADVYKWVDTSGKVHFSDQPPPTDIVQVEKKDVTATSPVAGKSDLPYALMLAVKKTPVTLYTTSNCMPCDEARVLLKKRGIPFAEKTINTNADFKRMKEISKENGYPQLFVGSSKQVGFEPTRWNTVLTAAGYPASSRLPASYRFAPAEPFAPKVMAEKADKPEKSKLEQKDLNTKLDPAKGNAPEGFRF